MISNIDVKLSLKDKASRVEEILNEYLPKEEGLAQTIMEAMNYSVLAGGKRLRPILMEEAYHLFGGQGDVIRPFMAAIEFIHTYSLVHDDLPAMDNDDLRRGKPTTHAKFGEAMGILAGDALLNYAYEVAASSFVTHPSDVHAGKAFLVLAKKAGIYGMVGGQVADVEAEKKHIIMTDDRLDFIYSLKTGALLEASLMVGAILAGASEEEVANMEAAGHALGMAFQIQDDILDITSTTETLGKPIGSDARNDKRTFVTIYGMEKAKDEVDQLSRQAADIIHNCSGDSEFLEALFLYLIHRTK